MSHRETYRNTLAYAVAIAGNERELAALLKVSVPEIENWLEGIETMPDRVFLAVVDVVLASSNEAISRSRELLTRRARG